MRTRLLVPALVALVAVAAACADSVAPQLAPDLDIPPTGDRGGTGLRAGPDAASEGDHILRGFVRTSRLEDSRPIETPLAGVEVEVALLTFSTPGPGTDSVGMGRTLVGKVVTGPDGSFELRGLKWGVYELFAKRPAGTDYSPTVVYSESFREEQGGLALIYMYPLP